jgi:hypothetical protein
MKVAGPGLKEHVINRVTRLKGKEPLYGGIVEQW